MKTIPPTFIPAGTAGGSSEPSAARREVLRRIATGVVLGAPSVLMGGTLKAATATDVCLYTGEALSRYGFPDGHPLGADRQGAFLTEAELQGLLAKEIGRAHV